MIKVDDKRLFWSTLAIFSLASALVSLCIGLKQSVWFDEAYSILLARQSYGDIVQLTSQDVHPPVYYWLLKTWMAISGDGELALRSLSVLFLGGSVAMIGVIARRVFGAKTAMLMLPFVAFAPFLVRYGFEIRMYSMVSFIGVLGTYILLLAVEQSSIRTRRQLLCVYAILVALGVYTLYFSVLIWMTHLAWILWRSRATKRTHLAFEAITAYGASFLLFLPWIPVFLSRAGGSTLSSVTHQLNVDNLIGIISFAVLYESPWRLGMLGVAVGLVIASIFVLSMTAYKAVKTKEKPYLILLAGYVVVPVLVLIVVTYFQPIYLERYMAHIIIGGYAFVGVSAAVSLRGRRRIMLLPISVIAVSMIAGLVSLAHYGNYNFQRASVPVVNQVATHIECSEESVVFADDPMIAIEIEYYIRDCPIRFASSSFDMSGGYAPLSESPLRTVEPWNDLRSARKIYYVYYDNPKLAMPSHFERVETYMPGNMAVAVYTY